MTDRDDLLHRWAVGVLGADPGSLAPASSDASFRRYWRARRAGHTLILMDAPPEREDCGRFADLAGRLRAIGLNAPEVFAEDRANGFLALSDLGERPYLDALDDATADRLYGDALAALATLQACGPVDGLPVYDAPFLHRELEIFREWFLGRHLGIALAGGELAGWQRTCDLLVANALEQPQVCVHRDYHARNLMVVPFHNPGILDFQDAVVGPFVYDLVSLLKDCYIAWPAQRVRDWALGYLELAIQSGVVGEISPERFLGWLDLMGVQRHLKACGIFARLNHRDGKPHYLADIPRTLGYVREVTARYPGLADLDLLLARRVAAAGGLVGQAGADLDRPRREG